MAVINQQTVCVADRKRRKRVLVNEYDIGAESVRRK